MVVSLALALDFDEEIQIPQPEPPAHALSLSGVKKVLNHPRSYLKTNFPNRRFEVREPSPLCLRLSRLDDAPRDHRALLEFAFEVSKTAPQRPFEAFVSLLRSDPFAKTCESILQYHEIVIGKTKIFLRFPEGRAQAEAFQQFLIARGIRAQVRPKGKLPKCHAPL